MSLWERFQSLCFQHGDSDAIQLPIVSPAEPPLTMCYLELQELAHTLACQVWYRYGRPSYVWWIYTATLPPK